MVLEEYKVPQGHKSVRCLRGNHHTCNKQGEWSYISVVTGQPVTGKGKCTCDCHKPSDILDAPIVRTIGQREPGLAT